VAPLGRRRAPHGRPLTARRACATTPPKHTGSELPCRTGSSWQRRGPMGPLGGRGRATVAAFASGTWICEALLRSLIEDPVVRWAMACGVGAALSALAAPCGVTGSLPAAPPPATDRPGTDLASAAASGAGSVAIGGCDRGDISTSAASPGLLSPPSPDPPAPPPSGPPPSAAAATASGEQSIAIAGDNHGRLATGDTSGGAPR
jgi:hypothetical protein